jgi:FixJ family two-component response regulator
MFTMSETILFVDDDVNVLSALQRSLYRTFQIEIAGNAQDALRALAQSRYAVVVSDLKMPGLNGIEFLSRVCELSPETTRVLLTGHAGLEAAIAAVNDGNLFRFLTKPCTHETLAATLEAALEQHRLQCSQRELLTETVMGTVNVLVSILAALHPRAFGRASRVRQYVQHIAAELNLADPWQLEVAAMLSHIGCIMIPLDILRKEQAQEPLSPEQFGLLLSHPEIGCGLLRPIKRLEGVAAIIARQREPHLEALAAPAGMSRLDLEVQILRAALDLDRQVESGRTHDAAVTELERRRDYHPAVLAALSRFDGLRAGAPEPLSRPGVSTALPCGDGEEHKVFRQISRQVIQALRR